MSFPNKCKLFKDSFYLVVLVLWWSVMRCNLLLEPRIPSLSSGFPLVIPPNSLSTMKAVTLSFSTPYNKFIKFLENNQSFVHMDKKHNTPDKYESYVYIDFCFGEHSEDVCNATVGDPYFSTIKKKRLSVLR